MMQRFVSNGAFVDGMRHASLTADRRAENQISLALLR